MRDLTGRLHLNHDSTKQIDMSLYKFVGDFVRRSVGKRLRLYGLRFEDIIDNDATLVNAAVTRMTPEEQLAREARLRRALDISAKKTALPAEMQAAHDPNANDLFKHIINITAEETERQEILGKQDYQ